MRIKFKNSKERFEDWDFGAIKIDETKLIGFYPSIPNTDITIHTYQTRQRAEFAEKEIYRLHAEDDSETIIVYSDGDIFVQ